MPTDLQAMSAAAVDALLTKIYGDAWHEWVRETLEASWVADGGDRLSEADLDRMQAIQTLHTTEQFTADPLIFEKIILALNGHHIDPTLVQVCTPGELAYGMLQAMKVKPVDKARFSDAVIAYIQACMAEAGLVVYPAAIRFAEPKYEGSLASLASAVRDSADAGNVALHTDPVQVQRGKLSLVSDYVTSKLKREA